MAAHYNYTMNTTKTVTADAQMSTEKYKAGKEILTTFIDKVTPVQLVKWHAEAACHISMYLKLSADDRVEPSYFLLQLGTGFMPEYIKHTIDDKALVKELFDLFKEDGATTFDSM
jgi:hypothetical protein